MSPHAPRVQQGLYWGYSVRLASSISSVFMDSPFSESYDLVVGTSDKGESVDEVSLPAFK